MRRRATEQRFLRMASRVVPPRIKQWFMRSSVLRFRLTVLPSLRLQSRAYGFSAPDRWRPILKRSVNLRREGDWAVMQRLSLYGISASQRQQIAQRFVELRRQADWKGCNSEAVRQRSAQIPARVSGYSFPYPGPDAGDVHQGAGLLPEYSALGQAAEEILRPLEVGHFYVGSTDFTHGVRVAARAGGFAMLFDQPPCPVGAVERRRSRVKSFNDVDPGEDLRRGQRAGITMQWPAKWMGNGHQPALATDLRYSLLWGESPGYLVAKKESHYLACRC